MEKQFKVYQVTNNGKWWLKEVVLKNDGTISFLNTYDEKEATILFASEVNEILYRVQTETNADIADIYTEEVSTASPDDILKVMIALKSLMKEAGDSDISISDDDCEYAVRVLGHGVQLCKQDEDGFWSEEMFLEVRR
jgi:hypothetical protein